MSRERIYVGNLPRDIREHELDDLFYKYGRIRSINVKSRAGSSAYAFIEYDDSRDAEDAVRDRDGMNFEGSRIRVEHLRGDGGRGGRREERGGGRRSEFRCVVEGLPQSGSWQDLKDHMRPAGNVTYTQVDQNGGGVVEFGNEDDMNYALKNLDDTKFTSRTGETSYVRLRPEGDAPARRDDRDSDRRRDDRDSDRRDDRDSDRRRDDRDSDRRDDRDSDRRDDRDSDRDTDRRREERDDDKGRHRSPRRDEEEDRDDRASRDSSRPSDDVPIKDAKSGGEEETNGDATHDD